MKTGYKMVGSGVMGGIIVMAGVLVFLERQHIFSSSTNAPAPTKQQSTATTTTTPSNVVIKVIQDQSVNASQQNQVYSTVQQMLQGSNSNSFDASGFIQYVYRKAGVNLPRTIADQSQAGTLISDPTQLQQGDLVFFDLDNAGTASFDGIYLGNNQFAAVTTHGLMAISMNDPYWHGKYLYGRRVL